MNEATGTTQPKTQTEHMTEWPAYKEMLLNPTMVKGFPDTRVVIENLKEIDRKRDEWVSKLADEWIANDRSFSQFQRLDRVVQQGRAFKDEYLVHWVHLVSLVRVAVATKRRNKYRNAKTVRDAQAELEEHGHRANKIRRDLEDKEKLKKENPEFTRILDLV